MLALGLAVQHRVPVALAVLVAMVMLLGVLLATPSVAPESMRLTDSQEQLVDGSGSGWGVFWTAVGVAGIVVGICILAPTVGPILAGAATVKTAATVLTGLGAVGGGFWAASKGAQSFGGP